MLRGAVICQCGVTMAILLKLNVFITSAVSYLYRLYTTCYRGLCSSATCLDCDWELLVSVIL